MSMRMENPNGIFQFTAQLFALPMSSTIHVLFALKRRPMTGQCYGKEERILACFTGGGHQFF